MTNVGIDVAKEVHWVCAVDTHGTWLSPRSDESAAFYARKRKEGKRRHQIIVALARRRVNVLWPILHNRTPMSRSLIVKRATCVC
jgi:hypothetical protein